MSNDGEWRKCSSCKAPIGLGQEHYVCSVSTCNTKRTGLVFCSLPCWERHLPIARHRDASAFKERAPTQRQPAETTAQPDSSPRRIIPKSSPQSTTNQSPQEILVVASKLKDYIRSVSGMNTSASAMPALSELIRRLCDGAIENARRDERKTVMDRDF